MKYNHLLRGALLATTMSLVLSQPVLAQAVASAQPNTPPPQAAAVDPGYVVLSDFVKPCLAKDKHGHVVADPDPQLDCATPRVARPSTIGPDSPVVSRADYLRNYWHMGEAGYNNAVAENKDLCVVAHGLMSGMLNLDDLLVTSDNEEQVLTEIYEQLPDEVKRNTRVMQVTQVVQAGLLCLLSAGLYCIAAAVGNGGNVVIAEASLHLQLANIRLSIANIVLTRANTFATRIYLRSEGIWLKSYAPFCQKLGYDTVTGFQVNLPPFPTAPAGFGGQANANADHPQPGTLPAPQ